MSLKQQAVRGVKWTSGATLFTTLLNILQLLVLGWLLESDDFVLVSIPAILLGGGFGGGLGVALALLAVHIATIRERVRELASLLFRNQGATEPLTGAA